MKLLIEESDIQEVKNTLADYYDIHITDEQAKSLIESNPGLAADLYECDGFLDTQARETLSSCVVKLVMKDWSPPKYKDKWSTSWSWPMYGSPEEYKKEFDEEFRKAAIAVGVKLGSGWDDKDKNESSQRIY